MNNVQLLKLARAATPGPWHIAQDGVECFIAHENGCYLGHFFTSEMDMRHSAAWSPDRAIAALIIIEAAQSMDMTKLYRALETWRALP